MESAPAAAEAAFIRARRPEQKQQRSAAILNAARRLALRDGVGAVSLGGIAGEVGMHKSALLKYFGTREEILLRIADDEWRSWADGVVGDLRDAALDDDHLADALTASFSGRPLFCQLLTYSALTLERNVSLEAVRHSKRAALDAASRVADAVHRSVPALGRESCLELVTTAALVSAGLWQIAHPSPVVLALHLEPGFLSSGNLAVLPFDAALGRFLRVYLDGLRHAS